MNSIPSVPIITLLTDFGMRDTYVGVMKGVIASINPDARVIDLCHDVSPQDVREAAFLLSGSFDYFPPGTIHIAVVDPTVGSDRPAVCVQSGDYFFVGPDNGVLSIACYRAGRPKIFLLENENYFLENRSWTFHGRDVFAPMAAHLSAGVPIESFGRLARSIKRIRLPRSHTVAGKRITGRIVYADRFGNLVTNIEQGAIQQAFPQAELNQLAIMCSNRRIEGLSQTYIDVPSGEALALIGSYNFMEIAVRNGNAMLALGVGLNDRIIIEPVE